MPDSQNWAEVLRNKIETSGKSRYAISQATGIGENMLSRLMAGKTVSLATAERLADYFGLVLTDSKNLKNSAKAAN